MRSLLTAAVACLIAPAALGATSPLEPLRLRTGSNPIADIAGDGRPGTINLSWLENGNAWSRDVFTVAVGSSIVTLKGARTIEDQPHTGEDMLRSVRFARGVYGGRKTLVLLIADRKNGASVPDPARTEISIYALARSQEPLGTPYVFAPVRRFTTTRLYCHADMALKTELGFPLARTYEGAATQTGC